MSTSPAPTSHPAGIPYVRLAITGVFMGLANLVPGVSGGTMVLVFGLYDEFINAVSDLTRFKISLRAIMVLAMLFGISALTILLFAGGIQFLMEMFKPGMLALFIGMTLGGAPALYREMKPLRPAGIAAAVVGILVMAAVAFLLTPDLRDPNWALLFMGGIIGSMAMILPGISGSYMLLVLGLYLPIIGGVSDLKDALQARDITLAFNIGMTIVLPVGLGVVIGVLALSNLLKFMLARHHAPTIGFLMGLLLGSVLGLYPFQVQTFDKESKHAITTATGGRELLVRGFGWEATETNAAYQRLMRLNSDQLAVRVLSANAAAVPTEADVELARGEKSIIIAYDVNVPRAVRRAAANKESGEVSLVIAPNSEFSVPKAILVVVLILVGFGLTWFLGRFGEGSQAPQGKAPQAA